MRRVRQKDVIQQIGIAVSSRSLHFQDLAADVEFEPGEAFHEIHGRAEGEGGYDGEQIEPGANRHANGHGEEDEPDVARLLDRIAEADDRKRADQGKGARDVRSDDQHDHGNDHAHHHQRLDVRLAVGDATVRGAVDQTDERTEHERQRHRQDDVRDREGSGQVLEPGEGILHIHQRTTPVNPGCASAR